MIPKSHDWSTNFFFLKVGMKIISPWAEKKGMIGWDFLCVVFQKKLIIFFLKVGHWAPQGPKKL
jgi:hypothetical protein